MSIEIIKAGIADSLQDKGRYGFQHLGIQPHGALDFFSAQLSNYILNNKLDQPVFELHFPASSFLFNAAYKICITGANFVPTINKAVITLNEPIQVHPNDVLTFVKPLTGKVAYLAIEGHLEKEAWLDSYSHLDGRLQKGAIYPFKPITNEQGPAKAAILARSQEWAQLIHNQSSIRILPGPAWEHLTDAALNQLLSKPFQSTLQSNRMGYLLKGPLLDLNRPNQYLSAGVTRGTLQLLPNGSVTVLMADHQTIGGYANLGQIILVDLPRFAQLKNDTAFHFSLTNVNTAHQLYQQIQKGFIH
jgi:antagonist of KipI